MTPPIRPVVLSALAIGGALLVGACAGPELSGTPVGPSVVSPTASPGTSSNTPAPATPAPTTPAPTTFPAATPAPTTPPVAGTPSSADADAGADADATADATADAETVADPATPAGSRTDRQKASPRPTPTITFPTLDRELFDWVPGVARVDDIGHVRGLSGGPGHWTIRFDRVALAPCDGALEQGCNHSGGRIVDANDRLRTYSLDPGVRILDRSDPLSATGRVLDPEAWFARIRADQQQDIADVVDLTVTAGGTVTAADIPFTS